jgi:hypothetical protein
MIDHDLKLTSRRSGSLRSGAEADGAGPALVGAEADGAGALQEWALQQQQ